MNLLYIDDLVNDLINALEGRETRKGDFCDISCTYQIELGKIAELIKQFKMSREDLSIPDLADPFTKKLYSTYISYLPEDQFSYPLKMNIDQRGSFTEFIRTSSRGQVSVNISKPGVIKGNHWHHTKFEKFLVVSGQGVIRFRKIDTESIQEYFVTGERMEVIDVPVGYTHNIENLGDTDLIMVLWVNEPFDKENPDTFYQEV